MLKLLRHTISVFKSKLPQNKLRAEHNSMVLKLKELELQVIESAKQLETAKSSFLKNVYHEIRTPLNSIVGFTNLLNRDNLLTELDKKNYRTIIKNSSSNFLHVIDDLIQASLLEAGMVKLDKDACNLGVFMKENHSCFSIRKHVVKKDSIALLQNVQDDFKDVNVLIDKFRVTQILIQLIDNAFKFTDKGTVEYGFTIKNNTIEFFVNNAQTSIEQEKEAVVFSKFSKLDSSNHSKDGLGLGLSICKDLSELMGGKIWYNSSVETGTSFYFSVPYIPVVLSKNNSDIKKGFLKPSYAIVPKDHNSLAV